MLTRNFLGSPAFVRHLRLEILELLKRVVERICLEVPGALALLELVLAKVGSNAVKPGAEVAVAPELLKVPVGVNEGLLRHVRSSICIAQHTIGNVVDFLFVLRNQGVKQLFLSTKSTTPAHESVVLTPL